MDQQMESLQCADVVADSRLCCTSIDFVDVTSLLAGELQNVLSLKGQDGTIQIFHAQIKYHISSSSNNN